MNQETSIRTGSLTLANNRSLWCNKHPQLSVSVLGAVSCSDRSIRLVEPSNFIFLALKPLVRTDSDCNTLCQYMPAILKPRQITNSPARIAFPGWVSLAFPAGAAAASRPRGLTNVPFSCMATNLPGVSPLQACTGAQSLVRLGCADDACQTRTELPASPFPAREPTPGAFRGSWDVLCATSVARHHGNAVTRQREDDVAWVGPPPGNTGGFMRAAGRSAALCIMMKMPPRPGLGLLCRSSHTLQPTQQKPAICCKAPSRFLWRR